VTTLRTRRLSRISLRRFFAAGLQESEVEKKLAETLDATFELVKKPDAAHLPGWCGPLDDKV
jgi:hypothetical protein